MRGGYSPSWPRLTRSSIPKRNIPSDSHVHCVAYHVLSIICFRDSASGDMNTFHTKTAAHSERNRSRGIICFSPLTRHHMVDRANRSRGVWMVRQGPGRGARLLSIEVMGTEDEVQAAASIAARGMRLIATAPSTVSSPGATVLSWGLMVTVTELGPDRTRQAPVRGP